MALKHLFFIGLAAGWAFQAAAQAPFWTYDQDNLEATIPPQCDGQFDEAKGGVIFPSLAELHRQGELFLQDPATQNSASYCFMAAALQGHVDSELRLAQMYNKGLGLPQDDIAAYRWAYIAALNGNKEASALALMLEKFLTTQEIQQATANVDQLLPGIKKSAETELAEAEARTAAQRERLEQLSQEIDKMLGVKMQPPVKKTSSDIVVGVSGKIEKSNVKPVSSLAPSEGIFSESDRM
ncbi:MAG: hypothetical protein PHX68_03375 [Alphaproteobacteria bacterium]|nr:hypothetical protein [Alphaproteobacteria bacterium]